MKKLSLMIACVGIISVAAFGSGFPKTNPQDDSKKQKTQEVFPCFSQQRADIAVMLYRFIIKRHAGKLHEKFS